MNNLTGKTIDRYHILEPLGEGGMATVYKAYDTRLEVDMALKVIRTDNFAPRLLEQTLKRFEREAKSLARLTHPNIVKVTDYGEYDGMPYLVMPYLPGGTLKDRLKQGAFTWQESVQLLLPVARALAYAHEENIVHRDIKPANILLTAKGQPLLSDFGIAKILDIDAGSTLTGTGVGIGTPEYMAPEQWAGVSSLSSDIYSLGVVLYEMVIGRKPYVADTPAAIFLKQAQDPLPRPREIRTDIPESIEKVLLKALAKKPEDRYQTMQDMADALDGLLNLKATTDHKPHLSSLKQDEATLTDSSTEFLSIADLGQPQKQRSKPARSWWMVAIPIVVFLICGSIFLISGFFIRNYYSSTVEEIATATQTLKAPSPSKTPAPTVTIAPTEVIPIAYGFQACTSACNGQNNSASFKGGIEKIYIQFNYENFVPGAPYVRTWTMEGREWIRYTCNWDGPVSGTEGLKFTEPGGLYSGLWEMKVIHNGMVVLTENITIIGNWTFWSPEKSVINTCHRN